MGIFWCDYNPCLEIVKLSTYMCLKLVRHICETYFIICLLHVLLIHGFIGDSTCHFNT